MYVCMYIYIYMMVYVYAPPPKTYLLDRRYVLGILFLTAYIVTCCNTTAGSTFSAGMAIKNNVHTTHVFDLVTIVALAGP